MKNWENLFQPHILDRGWDYYQSGCIKEVTQIENNYQAVIEGSISYEVEVECTSESITALSCTCPHAEGGSHCKHMAALLYYLQESDSVDESETIEELIESESMQALIEAASESEIKQFLLELAMQDQSLQTKITLAFSRNTTATKGALSSLKNEISDIVYRYERGGFIHYRESFDYNHDLSCFLEFKVKPLIETGYHMGAFELINEVFMLYSTQDMDDSAGGTGMIADDCVELWQKILQKSNEQETDEIFDWFLTNQTSSKVIDYMQDYLKNFLMESFEDEKYLKKILADIDEQIASVAKRMTNEKTWLAYQYHDLIVKRVELMKRLDYDSGEIEDYAKPFRHLPAIRELEINQHLMNRNFNDAIAVILESKELDRDHRGLMAGYNQSLIDIYEKLNLLDQYKEALLDHLFTDRQENLTYVKKLKACCDAKEWALHLEQLLDTSTLGYHKNELLILEERYDLLRDAVIAAKSVYALDRYEEILKPKYPDELRDAYADCLKSEMSEADSRKEYRRIVKYLPKIALYAGGSKIATEIAGAFRRTYPRRRAMLDELKKAGF